MLIYTVFGLFVAITAAFFHASDSPLRLNHVYEREVEIQSSTFEGALSKNDYLFKNAKKIAAGDTAGEETVVVDNSAEHSPYLYVFPADGWLKRVHIETHTVENLVFVGGKVLGARVKPHTNSTVFYACDIIKGLLEINTAEQSIKVLSIAPTDATEKPIQFCDDVELSPNGDAIYFTDAMDRAPFKRNGRGKLSTMENVLSNFCEGKGSGRLLKYVFSTKKTHVLLDGIYFANGVTLTHDEKSLLVTESLNARIIKYDITDETPGKKSIFAENLGFAPDGISRASDGKTYWVAGASVIDSMYVIFSKYTWLRWVVGNFPSVFWPKNKPYGLVVRVNDQGEVVESLHDSTGGVVDFVTAVSEYKGKIYLGQLKGDSIIAVDVPK
eukprot:GDKI01030148.1.p1 GENE.GDKI01030148.1~~GDKI01030148.1.p1  ORF type:complete len:384 (-),score=46.08 GDKI01030148.1:63-1214(-)